LLPPSFPHFLWICLPLVNVFQDISTPISTLFLLLMHHTAKQIRHAT
jgi:hypothetical protein